MNSYDYIINVEIYNVKDTINVERDYTFNHISLKKYYVGTCIYVYVQHSLLIF